MRWSSDGFLGIGFARCHVALIRSEAMVSGWTSDHSELIRELAIPKGAIVLPQMSKDHGRAMGALRRILHGIDNIQQGSLASQRQRFEERSTIGILTKGFSELGGDGVSIRTHVGAEHYANLVVEPESKRSPKRLVHRDHPLSAAIRDESALERRGIIQRAHDPLGAGRGQF